MCSKRGGKETQGKKAVFSVPSLLKKTASNYNFRAFLNVHTEYNLFTWIRKFLRILNRN